MSDRQVVAGVDGSGGGRAAVLWAAAEAVRRGLPLGLVRAVSSTAPVPGGGGPGAGRE